MKKTSVLTKTFINNYIKIARSARSCWYMLIYCQSTLTRR